MVLRSSCRNARYLAALAPDGLSEFEQRLLDGHVEHCAACSAFAADVAGVTDRLRAAPLESPQFRVPFQAPSRWRMPRLSFLTAAAGIAATAAATMVVVVGGRTDPPAASARPVIVIDATSVEGNAEQIQFLHQLRDYRNAQHTTESSLTTDRKPGFNAG
jgi:hypothetical protein